MSEIVTTTQDSFRELCIRLEHLGRELGRRAADPTGQTAAEYMGVLLVIAAVVTAVAASGIGAKIGDAAKSLIDSIAQGKPPVADH